MGHWVAWAGMGAGVGAVVALLARRGAGDRVWPELVAGAVTAPLTVLGLCELLTVVPTDAGPYRNTLSLLGACGAVVAAVVCHLACHRGD